MVSQLLVAFIGLSVMSIGVTGKDFILMMLGPLITLNSLYTLFKLKTGHALTFKGFKIVKTDL